MIVRLLATIIYYVVIFLVKLFLKIIIPNLVRGRNTLFYILYKIIIVTFYDLVMWLVGND